MLFTIAYSLDKKEKNQKKELILTTISFLSLYISFFFFFFMSISFSFSFFVEISIKFCCKHCSYLMSKKRKSRKTNTSYS
nr:MAG TPA: hypothetical protein [Crassvirales sp.]